MNLKNHIRNAKASLLLKFLTVTEKYLSFIVHIFSMEKLIKEYVKNRLTSIYAESLLRDIGNLMEAGVDSTFGLECRRNNTVPVFGSPYGLFGIDGGQIKVIKQEGDDVLSITITSNGDILYGTTRGIFSLRTGKMIKEGKYVTGLLEIGKELYNVQIKPGFVRAPGEIQRTHTNETILVFEHPILTATIAPISEELEERISLGKVNPNLYEIKGEIEKDDVVILFGTPYGVYALHKDKVGKIADTEGAHSIFVASDGKILHGTRNGYVYETLRGRVINANRKNEETVSGIIEIGNKLYHSTGSWASGGLGQTLETKNDRRVVFLGPPIYCMTTARRDEVAEVLERASGVKTLIMKMLNDLEAELK